MINVISFPKPKQSSSVTSNTTINTTFTPAPGPAISQVTIWGNTFDGTQNVEGDLTILSHNLTVNGGNVSMLSSVWTESFFKFLQTTLEPSSTTVTDEDGNETTTVINGEYSKVIANNTVISLHSSNTPTFISDISCSIAYPIESKEVMSGIFFDTYYYDTTDTHATRIRKYDINTGIVFTKQVNVDSVHKLTNDATPIGVFSDISFEGKIYATGIENDGDITTGDVTCVNVNATGNLSGADVSCTNVNVTGDVGCVNLNAENLTVTGNVSLPVHKLKYLVPTNTTLDEATILNYDVLLYTGEEDVTLSLCGPTSELSGLTIKLRHLNGHNIVLSTGEDAHIYDNIGGEKVSSTTCTGLVEVYYFYIDENVNGIMIK